MIPIMMTSLTIVVSIPSGYFPHGSDAVDLSAEEPSVHVSDPMNLINVIYLIKKKERRGEMNYGPNQATLLIAVPPSFVHIKLLIF